MRIGRLMRQPVPGDPTEPGTLWLLKAISANGAVRLTDLAACTGLDASTVSRHVTQLHRQGLVERTPDPDDGRAQRVDLTELGQHRLADALHRRHELLARSLQGWDAADVDSLETLLDRFVRAAEELSSTGEKV